jgi:phage-related protein
VAISVGSVEVDVIPNTRGIYAQLRSGLVPAATRAGDDAGDAAGRSFGPAMQRHVGAIGLSIGEQIGRQIAARITAEIRGAMRAGVVQGGAAARASATRQGDQTGGAFSRSLKTRLEAAFRSLPKINIDASTSEADADLQALRVRMETLANKRIGIDIDAAAAKAEIKLIEAELTRLGAQHPNVQVRADTAAARAELAAVRAAIAAVDGKRINVNVSTAQATAALFQLTVAIAGLAVIPAIPVLAAGIGSIAAAGVAAGAGIGALAAVAIPAFVGIAAALQAQKAAQDAATTATARGGQANSQGASKALQMAGAQQALATAERNGARQIAQAQQQVRQAKLAAADAIVQAAQRNAQAARAIEDAERALARSQQDAKRAQEDLTQARRDAALELEDLNTRLAGAQLSQRDAVLGEKEALAELNRARAAGTKGIDLERIQLAYDQAVQRLKEQTTETKRLKAETADANKAGVEGSDTVRSAQDRLAQAQQQVADSARGVRDAQAEAARVQVETSRQVAQAQERVGEATANVANAQQAAAEAVAGAQRQIASASISAAGGVDQAAVAQAKYQAELAKLTPSARETFNAFTSLRSAFSAWSKSLQPQVMPIFTRALEGLKNSLPGLTPFVLAAARAVTALQERVSRGFKSPWWNQFRDELAGSVQPAIVGVGVSFGRIFKGMVGIIDAFLPHMDSISGRMQTLTGRFANWGTSLKGSPAFEKFLAYSAQMGPVLSGALRDIVSAFYEISRAASPLSGPVLKALGAIASAIADIARDLPWLIQLLYSVWIVTKLWTIAMAALTLVMNANPITLIIIGIVALVAAVIYAWKNFGWFRDVVMAVWEGIKTAALFVWNSVLKPVFQALVTAFKAVGTAASWLWTTILSPVFGFIGTAARILATIIVTIFILPVMLVLKVMGALFTWLWQLILKPAFEGIAFLAMWLWNNAIKPAFNGIMVGVRAVGSAATVVWKNVLKPAFQGIAWLGKWLWNNILKPVFESVKSGMRLVGDGAKILWNSAIKPAFNGISSVVSSVWEKGIRPVFDKLKSAVAQVGKAFDTARAAIKVAWEKVKGIAKGPVDFIVNTVYNEGIRGVWNKVADAFGAPKLDKFKFAKGGIMPGYTPGRDVHRFVSPTGGRLDLSGGEAIMRPEFTRAVGPGFIAELNRIASSRGSVGIKKALAPELGGNPTHQKFADGGIFGWIGKGLAGAGSAAWDKVKAGASWLKDGLESSARAGVKNVVNPLLKNFPGADTGFGKMIRKVPDKILDALFGYSKKADEKGAGGVGGPKIQAALKWAKTQNGLPYQWGGNGNPSWDCSGLVSAIESKIRGQKPHRRWATGAFSGKTAPPGWVLNGKSPFTIGITNAGVGHTAGTLGGTNVESRGGDGVVIGKKARGANASMFTHRYGFMPGKYDQGGYLPEGLSTVFNGTGRPEPVFTSQQASALINGRGLGGPSSFEGDLYLDSGEFLGKVRGEATQVVDATLGQLATTLSAGRRR